MGGLCRRTDLSLLGLGRLPLVCPLPSSSGAPGPVWGRWSLSTPSRTSRGVPSLPSALAGAWTCRGGGGGRQTAEVPFLLSQVRLFAELHFLYSSHNCLSPPLFAERPFVYLGGWGAEWPCLICRARRFLLIGDAFVSIIPRDPSPSVGHLAPWRRPRGGAGLGRRSSCRGVGVSRVTSEQGLAPHRLAQPVGLSAAPGDMTGHLQPVGRWRGCRSAFSPRALGSLPPRTCHSARHVLFRLRVCGASSPPVLTSGLLEGWS